MMRTNKKDINYLELIPKRSAAVSFDTDESGIVCIHRENKGILCRLTQLLLRKPKVSHIHLDELGSFVWLQIDGVRTVGEIAPAFEERFGERVHPTSERLCQFVSTLVACGFAEVQK